MTESYTRVRMIAFYHHNLKLVYILILALSASLLGCQSTIPDAGLVIAEMIQDDGCESPCFFGESLQNHTADEIAELLAQSSVVEPGSVKIRDTNGDQDIEWTWSEEGLQRISADDVSVSSEEANYIELKGDTVKSYRLMLAVRLSDLISQFGDPDWIEPFYPTRFGDMVFSLIYDNPLGQFQAWTRCDTPELSPDTTIRSFTYRQGFDSKTARDNVSLPDWIEWIDYTNDLPDCSFFRP